MAISKTNDMSTKSLETVEDVLQSVGGFGRFQFLVLLLFLSFEIPAAFVVFSPVFTGVTPNRWLCNNLTIFKDDPEFCECEGNLKAIFPASSIVAEWSLVCSKGWIPDFLTTLMMLGMVFGNLFTGLLADWYGRRWTFLSTVGYLAGGTVVSAFAPNVYVYGGARFVCGMGYAGYVNLSMSYAMEYLTPEWRALCVSVGPLGEGIMLLGVLGYLFKHSWRNLLLVTAAPFVILMFILAVPESPRWLLRQKRIEDAQKVFNSVAKVNNAPGVDLDSVWKISGMERNNKPAQIKKVSYVEFFKNKENSKAALILSSIWAMWSLMYFGISFNMRNLGGNPYINVIYMGLCDAVGYPVAYVMNDMFTRRQSLAGFMSGSACFFVTLAVLQLTIRMDDKPDITLLFCLLGKFCAGGARACARLLTAESFATEVRNIGGGVVGIAGTLTGLAAPALAYLGTRWPSIPLLVFGICSFIGASCSFLLSETKGQALSEGVPRKSIRQSIVSIVHAVRRRSMMGAARSAETRERYNSVDM